MTRSNPLPNIDLIDFQNTSSRLISKPERWQKMLEVTSSQQSASSAAANRAIAVHPSEYLAFNLGSESYGIDIHCVQEIRSYEQPTRMATAPDFIKGVVNLRGVIVPIVDMRIKFGMSTATYNAFTAVIVINVASRVVGLVVDVVSDVISLSQAEMRPVPEFASSVISDHIRAIGSVQDRMLILLDIERLMSSAEMGLLAETVN